VSGYEDGLNLTGSGLMGYIDIDRINVELPIYHGIEKTVLQVGAGHMPGSSLPIGGDSTHCVLSGHRGLPSAKLFTDLDEIEIGDTFTITILNRCFTYEVDQIKIVLPEEFDDLRTVEGKDYCTLLTCTPYGINTHRLLVRGHRTANANGDAEVIADAIQIEPAYIAPFIAVPVLILLMIAVFISTGRRSKRRKQKLMAGFGNPEQSKDRGSGKEEKSRRRKK
jgi:sortase A